MQSEKKRLLIMGVIASVLMIFGVISWVNRAMKSRQIQKSVALTLPEVGSLKMEKIRSPRFLEKQKAQEDLLKQPWGRNPFSKAVVKPEVAETVKEKPVKEAQFVLEGVVLRGSSKVALINGNFLREGEDIQNTVVKLIEQKRVILEKEGKEIILELEA